MTDLANPHGRSLDSSVGWRWSICIVSDALECGGFDTALIIRRL
jgi:hypothetical protein